MLRIKIKFRTYLSDIDWYITVNNSIVSKLVKFETKWLPKVSAQSACHLIMTIFGCKQYTITAILPLDIG